MDRSIQTCSSDLATCVGINESKINTRARCGDSRKRGIKRSIDGAIGAVTQGSGSTFDRRGATIAVRNNFAAHHERLVAFPQLDFHGQTSVPSIEITVPSGPTSSMLSPLPGRITIFCSFTQFIMPLSLAPDSI